jgi:ribonuclease Z
MTLEATFLGTSGAVPTVDRNLPGIMVQREGRRLLFDVGEGTQRQMIRFGTGFDVTDIFVTHTHGDHVLGLPGLVQTFDFNDRTAPLTVHVPPGERAAVANLIGAVDTSPSFDVTVRTATPGAVALAADEFEVRAINVDHTCTAVGYVLAEEERKGRFDRQKAEEELDIPPGPAYSALHRGETVELDDGRVIEPEQVVGPPRPGRTLAYTGDTRPTDAVVAAAADAELLIHDATFADDRADRAPETGHSTARDAARIANRAGVDRLALTHVSSRYAPDASRLEAEAGELFDGPVDLASDGLEIDVPFPD